MCLAWDEAGEFIATGSLGTVKVWNVKLGRVVQRMTVGLKDGSKKDTVIWCVGITRYGLFNLCVRYDF